jgi:hypothetical protein
MSEIEKLIARDKKLVKTKKVLVIMTDEQHEAIQESVAKSGCSMNSTILLCIDLSLGKLPNYKVNDITVNFKQNGNSKQIKYSGNSWGLISNFKNKK